MIKKHCIESIKSSIDLVSFLSQYLSLKRVGRNYQCLCPFHNETTPSFTVNPEKNLYHCFGCGAAGDAAKFLTEHGYSFPEAMEVLSEYTGIPLEYEEDLSNANVNQEGTRLKKIVSIAHTYYKSQLSKASSFLEQRQLTNLNQSIGYAPLNINSLLSQLKSYSNDDLKKVGIKSFRDRVIFPIHNHYGEVIAFTGRRVSTDKKYAKYINSPSSSIYQKNNILFGYYQNKQLKKKRLIHQDFSSSSVILTEGTIDVFRLIHHHIPCIGLLSTGLSKIQKQLIEQSFKELILCLDSDKAGVKATYDLINQQWSIPLYVIQTGKHKDIDDYLVHEGIESFIQLVNEKQDKVNWILSYLLSQPHNKYEQMDELLDRLKSLFNNLTSKEQAFYEQLFINRISSSLKITKERVQQLIVNKSNTISIPTLNSKTSIIKDESINVKTSDSLKDKEEEILSLIACKQVFDSCIEEICLSLDYMQDKLNDITFVDSESSEPIPSIKLKILELGHEKLKKDRSNCIEQEQFDKLIDINCFLNAIEHKINLLLNSNEFTT